MRTAVVALLAAMVGCAHHAPRPPPDAPTPDPVDQTRRYTIWLGGARVGTAVETEQWTAQAMTLTRRETMRFMRGDSEVRLATEIVVDTDHALAPRHVRWTETGAEARAAEATWAADGWRVSTGGTLPAHAMPAELVTMLVRRDHRFEGSVFLPARGFVTGTGRIEPVAQDRLIARLVLAGGDPSRSTLVEATIDLDRDGMPARIVDGEGVIAIRASEATALEDFPSVDLIAATAIPIGGYRTSPRLVLDGNLALPALPGQRVRPQTSGVEVELSPSLHGEMPAGERGRDRSSEIRALVAAVRARITPDLGAGPTSTRHADEATKGDCTTFALAYAALATARGIETRVVTGLRVDHARLVRHRWAVSWTGTRWIAIDAAFGRAPAGGDLIGLAVHGADDAGLVAGEAALTQVRTATWSAPAM